MVAKYQATDVRRLILEVQAQRYFLSELRDVADVCRVATENERRLADRIHEMNNLLRQIDAQLKRVDKVYRSPPIPHPNAPNFRNRQK
ncbi:hypothetical protein [Paraburkholderia sp. BCC1885]|uniref:hypothetical protein n=1 Tax=Paraburkholderia sp. BCC1885 TaxID=2562669 RepID=UPI001183D760|nr:hypothetical protein [Paraburkholderia sp. BCC1885]